MKKIITFVISVVLSYFTATPVGKWFDENYVSGGFIYWGPFPGFLDGLLLSYVFFSALLLSLFSQKIKTGFYFSLPILILDIISGSYNPQLWLSLILLALGLGLAYLILLLTRKAGKKIFQKIGFILNQCAIAPQVRMTVSFTDCF